MRIWSVITTMVMAAYMNAATPYHTPKLAIIANAVGIHLADTLDANVVIDSVAFFKGKDIHVRTNNLGDVEHVGYNIFSSGLHEIVENSQVLDFLERYLLELDLGLGDLPVSSRMDVDQVNVVKGSLQTLRQLNPSMDLNFSLDVKARKMYRVTCKFNKETVQITIPCINELIMGAKMSELEDIFKRDVQRMVSISGDAILQDWSDAKVSKGEDVLIIDGGCYLSKMIRGDIYLKEVHKKRSLICDITKASRSVINVMLTGIFERDIPFNMLIDRYDGKRDSVQITLQQFIAYCKAEGCKLYFGIKTMTDDTLAGTFFAYNEGNAYDHMLSVNFPFSILEGSNEAVSGKVYTYIPLHFVADKYFDINNELITD